MSFNGKSVPYEDQWCIMQAEFWFVRQDKGYAAIYHPVKDEVTGQHMLGTRQRNWKRIHPDEDPPEFSVVKEPRYYIHGHWGNAFFEPWSLCIHRVEFKGCLEKLQRTATFRKAFDNSHFIYYDEAEARLNNMITFVKWIKARHQLPKIPIKLQRLLNQFDFKRFLRDEWLTPERIKIMNSSHGLKENALKKSDLKGLALTLVNNHTLRFGEKAWFENPHSNAAMDQD